MRQVKLQGATRYMYLLLLFLLLLTASGCVQVGGSSNYTLAEGEAVSGPLLLFSQNAILEKDSAVDGSVVMLCCNLKIDGNVSGNVFLLTGNLWISSYGDVDGKVHVISGNLTR